MAIVLVLVVYAAYLLFDFRPLAMSKNRKIIIPYLVLFCIGVVVQTLYALNVNIPSPSTPIAAVISGLFNLK